ncbi:MAG TPA: ABC transporter substrate-binding protein, partial [Chloroflexota bacterium]|nr:ABC transporter substrate-binding protein [Chloroflexota bacterium]
IFDKNGLNVELQMVASTAVMAALLSNQVQMATLGGAEVLNADVGGADVMILANLAPGYSFKFEAAKEIKTKEDLIGKKVSYTRPGSTTDIGMHAGLAKIGLDPYKDVTFVQMDTAQQSRDALISGAVQGTMLQPPETLVVEKQGFHPLFDFADLGLPAANATIAVRKSWLDGHRDVAQKYIDSIVQGAAREKADKALAVGVLKKYFKNDDPAQLDETYTYFSRVHPALPYATPDQFAQIIETGSQTNPKLKDFNVASVLDSSFVKSAEDRGLNKG